LPPSRVALTPGDVVALTSSGRRRLLEIRDIVDTQSRAIKARSIDPEVFNLPLEREVMAAPELPPAIGPVEVRLLDLPVLDEEASVVLTRAALFAQPWQGPVDIWRSRDGASYERAAAVFAPAVMGETIDPLPKGPVFRFDDATILRVKLYGGALASVSDLALLSGANLAALQGPDGTCEIVQFAKADLVGDRIYELSRLLRGQGGTEWAMADPLPAGSAFVLLDAHVVPIARGLDMLGRPLSLRIVAGGRGHNDASAVILETTPPDIALRPYAPVHLRAMRSDEGIVLSWIRRTRAGGDSWEVQEVPLGEFSERYVIDILDGVTVKRVLETASPQVLYPAADEIADFGAPVDALAVRVTQVSALVGRGWPAQAILPVT